MKRMKTKKLRNPPNKMWHNLFVATLGLAGFCLLLGACDESACDTSTRTAIQLKFYSRTTDSIPRDTVVERDLEGIYGIGREDSEIYEGAFISVVTMPVPLAGHSCRFLLEFQTTSKQL